MATTNTPELTEALGRSPAFLDLQEKLARYAGVDRPVLLIGERGTGKELAAARLHYLSTRWQGPLVRWNCAAYAPELIASELFGHEAGSFTGAQRRRLGRFEQADGGTLFLDEVGQMPAPLQEKLLRVIEYGKFERVGGEETIEVDVRILGATNADLAAQCREGKFREDLLDRLAFGVVHLPPLRERQEDIPLLARHFTARMAAELDRPGTPELTPRAEKALLAHDWPGNIRELRNTLERAVLETDGDRIEAIELNPLRSFSATSPHQPADQLPTLPIDLNTHLEEMRQKLVAEALRTSNFHQRKAASLLGLSYDQFRAIYRRRKNNAANPQAPAAK